MIAHAGVLDALAAAVRDALEVEMTSRAADGQPPLPRAAKEALADAVLNLDKAADVHGMLRLGAPMMAARLAGE